MTILQKKSRALVVPEWVESNFASVVRVTRTRNRGGNYLGSTKFFDMSDHVDGVQALNKRRSLLGLRHQVNRLARDINYRRATDANLRHEVVARGIAGADRAATRGDQVYLPVDCSGVSIDSVQTVVLNGDVNNLVRYTIDYKVETILGLHIIIPIHRTE